MVNENCKFAGYTRSSLDNMASFARSIQPSQRREDSFRFHTVAKVSGLPAGEQAKFLDRAEAEHLSARELEALVKPTRQ